MHAACASFRRTDDERMDGRTVGRHSMWKLDTFLVVNRLFGDREEERERDGVSIISPQLSNNVYNYNISGGYFSVDCLPTTRLVPPLDNKVSR